jgi:hypothetical protein
LHPFYFKHLLTTSFFQNGDMGSKAYFRSSECTFGLHKPET